MLRALCLCLCITTFASACASDGARDEATGAATTEPADPAGTVAESEMPEDADARQSDGVGAADDGPATAPGGDVQEASVEPAAWSPCDDGFECASVSVPLSHDDPSGERLDIALIRLPATGNARASIFINPGGPGGSGVTVVRSGFTLDEETMANYHLVGFDPRGIGQSAGLECQLDLAEGPRPDFSPDTPAEREALDDQAKELAAACAETDGALLPHLGTDAVVEDLDLLRRAVGDERLHYIGLSYGTLIGLLYAERRPGLVGHMVLDGVVDPAFALTDLLRQQAGEFERAFITLDSACGRDLQCPEGGIATAYDQLMSSLEQSGPQGEVGTAELQIATLVSMHSERLWQRYATALDTASNGDLAEIEQLHDIYVSGTSYTSYVAVSCIDSRSPSGSEAWDALATQLTAIAPRFGAALANEVRTCAFWPVTADTTQRRVTAPGSDPILVLSTTGDAPTPLTNAINVAASLSSAVLVTTEDEGHTAYGKSFCIERIVAGYFNDDALPDDLHRC